MTLYTTMDDFKDYLGIEGVISAVAQNSLDMALTNSCAIIDSHTHRTFAAASDSIRRFDALLDVQGLRLWLDTDLASLTSVVNGNSVAIPLNAFVLEPSVGPPYYAINLKRTGGLSWMYEEENEQAIVVTGKWAYSVTPPDTIVQATLRLAAWLYHQRDNALDLDRTVIVGGTVIAPAAMPADVMTILRPFMKVVV